MTPEALQDLVGLPSMAAVNLHLETDSHFLELHHFGFDLLVVTFEDAGSGMERPDRYRTGWGAAPFLRRGVSVLAVKPRRRSFYAPPDLGVAFARMRPFLDRYGALVTYGMSMGGFGALTYADTLGADRVVAVAPKSTYRPISPFAQRFADAADWDHSGPLGDAPEGCKTPADVWLLHDRMERQDRWHADRFQGANIRHLGMPYFAHGVPRMLQNVGALGMVVDLIVTGQIDRTALYQKARARREFAQYQNFLYAKARQHRAHMPRLEALLGPDPGHDPAAIARFDDKNDEFSSLTE